MTSRFTHPIVLAAATILGLSVAGAASITAELGRGKHDLWRVISYLCVPSASLGVPLPRNARDYLPPSRTPPALAEVSVQGRFSVKNEMFHALVERQVGLQQGKLILAELRDLAR